MLATWAPGLLGLLLLSGNARAQLDGAAEIEAGNPDGLIFACKLVEAGTVRVVGEGGILEALTRGSAPCLPAVEELISPSG